MRSPSKKFKKSRKNAKLRSINYTIRIIPYPEGQDKDLSKENLHHAACPRIYRIVEDLPVTDTFKYKKAAIKEDKIRPGDYFVTKDGRVEVLGQQQIQNILAGKHNDIF